jgi:hypothetical protein
MNCAVQTICLVANKMAGGSRKISDHPPKNLKVRSIISVYQCETMKQRFLADIGSDSSDKALRMPEIS